MKTNLRWIVAGLLFAGMLTAMALDLSLMGYGQAAKSGTGQVVPVAGADTRATCASVGSAANPSLVACTSGAYGAFSCNPAASGGTCVVSTTAVTANSRIFIQPSAAEGANLSVTCNAAADSGLAAPRLAAKSAGVSFTVNLGTFATNPVCFNFWIVN